MTAGFVNAPPMDHVLSKTYWREHKRNTPYYLPAKYVKASAAKAIICILIIKDSQPKNPNIVFFYRKFLYKQHQN